MMDMMIMMNQLNPFPRASRMPKVQVNKSAIGSSISLRFMGQKVCANL